MVESLQWATDIIFTKTSEQRIGLRLQPRRVFNFSHTLSDEVANYSRVLTRNAQGDSGFLVPDWTQTQSVGAISAGSGVVIPVDLSTVDFGTQALIWESESRNEAVTITLGAGNVTADVANTYANAQIMPLWPGSSPEGLNMSRLGAGNNNLAMGFILSESSDISASTYPQYRGHDVLTDCPVLGGSTFDETTAFSLSGFDNVVGNNVYLRARDLINQVQQMRWHVFERASIYALRQWLHSRKGRLKAFWLSSRARDLEPVSFSGTTLTVFNDVLTRPAPFDVEVVIDGASEYRQVTAAASGATIDSRATVDLTLDSALTGTEIDRISMFYCVRFDSDRVDLEHAAAAGVVVQVPVREVPVP
ncbi:MAG: hypothetical protein AAF662_08315 [Pseudomonadota bacterium]